MERVVENLSKDCLLPLLRERIAELSNVEAASTRHRNLFVVRKRRNQVRSVVFIDGQGVLRQAENDIARRFLNSCVASAAMVKIPAFDIKNGNARKRLGDFDSLVRRFRIYDDNLVKLNCLGQKPFKKSADEAFRI